MGPTLLLDKSALQSLSAREAEVAHQFYYLVYAPVLFIEILGDIKKVEEPDAIRRELAKTNAKLKATDSIFTVHYMDAIEGEAFGYSIPMDGRPLLGGSRQVVQTVGDTLVLFDEEPEREANRRWSLSEFSEAERQLATRWRETTKALDLVSWTIHREKLPELSSPEDAQHFATRVCTNPEVQVQNQRFLLTASGVGEERAERILKAWSSKSGLLHEHSPYAAYCFIIYLTFFACLAKSLIGTRPTNRVDLEYLLYLPFASMFVSGDKFQLGFGELFCSTDHSSAGAQAFKSDLARIAAYLDGLSEQDRSAYYRDNGLHPPDWSDSITNKLWLKHMKPRRPQSEWTPSPEVRSRIEAKLKPLLDAIRSGDLERGK